MRLLKRCKQLPSAIAKSWTKAAAHGVMEAAEPLKPTITATTLRMKEGDAMLVEYHGPFAETKEQLAGYYILRCKDLDEAIDWAKEDSNRLQRRRGMRRDSSTAR